MKVRFRLVGKTGFLLVVIGFLMPIFNIGTGRDLANNLMRGNNIVMGLLVYAVLVTAVIGIIIGVLLMMSKRTKIPLSTDWIVLLVCIGSGLAVFFLQYRAFSLGNGAFLILIGWIVALVGQVLSKAR